MKRTQRVRQDRGTDSRHNSGHPPTGKRGRVREKAKTAGAAEAILRTTTVFAEIDSAP